VRRERYWPQWLCWMFGHEPTERFSLAEDAYCCRCRVLKVSGMWWVMNCGKRIWTGLVGRLP
jgi:hypothetical protein